jgi:hypothetical protein
MARLAVDDSGYPVLFADVPNAGTTTADANAKSGNPNHDTRSGKFGGGGSKDQPSIEQSNIDPLELKLLRDAVRDAARLSDGLTQEDAANFLGKRMRDSSKLDMQKFLNSVREQRLEDLADILATQVKASVKGGNPKIKVTAPRGYAKRVLAGLSDDEVIGMAVRMERRGWGTSEIKRNLMARVGDDRREALEEKYGVEIEKWH